MKLYKKIFVGTFLLILICPVFGKNLDKNMELSGVSEEVEIEKLSLNNIMDGSF